VATNEKSAPASSPPAAVAAPPEWLDVLPLVDLKEDPPRHGLWSVERDGLQHSGHESPSLTSMLPLPLELEGSYRMQIEVSSAGGGIGPFLAFPVGGSWVRMILDSNRTPAHNSGLERVNGLLTTTKDNPTFSTLRMEAGKKYLVDLTVRVSRQNADVSVQIDGKNLFQWIGPTKEIALSFPQTMPGNPALCLLGGKPKYTVHSIRVQSHDNGSATLLHQPPESVRLPKFVKAPEKAAS
jgi:hypothetical protein